MQPESLNLDELWGNVTAEIIDQGISPGHRSILSETFPVDLVEGVLVLSVPSDFAKSVLKKRYDNVLTTAVSHFVDEPVRVAITVREDTELHPSVGDPVVPDEQPEPPALHVVSDAPPNSVRTPAPQKQSNLLSKYVFDRFVVGPGNRFAHAAALAVAESPAKAYNPLFIYGGSGLGKTHLLQAIGHYAQQLYPERTITYVTSERFTAEFIASIGTGTQRRTVTEFQRKYRKVDILLIDDIQFIERAVETQEEFFHTFNALHQMEKQIVLTSDRHPRRLERFEERLRTRFEMGLLTDVQPPDLETRLAILHHKADAEGVRVPDDVKELIATRISSNIRELEGALIRVLAAASLSKTPISATLAKNALKDVFPDTDPVVVTVDDIKRETAEYFDLTLDDICGPRRTRALVNARQIAMYLTRELTAMSLLEIGAAFNRDHTTVIHANKKIAELIKERPTTFEQIQDLTSRIKVRSKQ